MRTRTTPAHADVRVRRRRAGVRAPRHRDAGSGSSARRRTRWTAGAAAALTTLAAATVLGGGAAHADEQISSRGPLTSIRISNDLNCAVNHAGDESGEWYDDTACGTFVAVGGTLYGPASIPAGPGRNDPGYQAYTVSTGADGTPDNQTSTGTGTAADPYTVTTTVGLGDTGLSLVEVDTYVTGQESYATRVTLDNDGPDDVAPIIYRGGDCYLQDSDTGLGGVQNGNAPVCKAPAGSTDPNRIEAMYPLTAGSHYLEGGYSCVWQAVESQQPLPDEIDYTNLASEGGEDAAPAAHRRARPQDETPTQTPTDEPTDSPQGCTVNHNGGNPYDNGLALSWNRSVRSGASTSIGALTLFSPVGAAALTFAKTADADTAAASGVDGYTVTVSNPGAADQVLNAITDTLPDGFAYVTGSSTGATTGDPSVDGQNVTWTGSFVVPGATADGTPGSLSLHFAVTVADEPGTYRNSVTGTGDGVTVVPATRVAPVTVEAARPRPVAGDDAYTTRQDTPLTVAAPGVLVNDTDPNDASLFVTSDGGTAPANGTVTFDDNGDGGFVYTPGPGFSGIDSFTYRVSNGEETSEPATVRITVRPPNHAPIATKDSYTTNEDTTLTQAAPGVLGNDTDADGDPLQAVLGTAPTHGTFTLAADGSFTYRPDPDYNGLDSFTYQASDGTAPSDPVTVSITVTPVDDPIVARDDTATVARNSTLVVDAPGVLANDTDVDGRARAELLTGPAHGNVVLNTDGSYVYTPSTGYSGDDQFRYTAGDGSSATVRITVGVNHAPQAVGDEYLGYEDQPITANPAHGDTPDEGVLHNDSDPDHDTLTAVLDSPTMHGSLDFHPDGTFTYDPDQDFAGTDTFTYHAVDAGGLPSDTVTVTLTLYPLDDAPVAEPDEYSTPRDTPLVVAAPGVLSNDTDVDTPSADIRADLTSGPGHGSVQLAADGGFRYVPAAGFTGTDTFAYRARSGESGSAPVTVTIHVTPVNHAPSAAADSYTTPRDTTLTVPVPGVLGNDDDPDGNTLSAIRSSGPAHGTLTLAPTGRFVYRPDAGFTGLDTFRYRASDGVLSSPVVQVTIAVTAPGTPSTPTGSPSTSPTSAVPLPPSGTPPTSAPTDTPTGAPDSPVDVPPSGEPTVDEPTETPSSPATPPSSTAPSRAERTLRLTSPSVIPGGTLRAAGTGCAPNSTVALTIAGRSAGSGRAGADGRFDLPVATTGLGVGTYSVTASCGHREQVADVALVYVTADSTAPTAQALVVAAMLTFFLLLLGLVVRRPTP